MIALLDKAGNVLELINEEDKEFFFHRFLGNIVKTVNSLEELQLEMVKIKNKLER